MYTTVTAIQPKKKYLDIITAHLLWNHSTHYFILLPLVLVFINRKKLTNLIKTQCAVEVGLNRKTIQRNKHHLKHTMVAAKCT